MKTRAEGTPIPDFEVVERLARWLDSKYKIPGTNFTFGVDPIVGLIPGVGDAATFIIQGFLAGYMVRYGASRKVAIKMFLNVVIDTVFGSIPIIGGIGDFFYKANMKNIRLLKEHYQEGKHQGSGNGIIFLIIFMMLVLLVLFLWGAFLLFRMLINMF